jgi:hypothetical protein
MRPTLAALLLLVALPLASARAQDEKSMEKPADKPASTDKSSGDAPAAKPAEDKPAADKPAPKLTPVAERLKQALGLSDEQAAKVSAIETETREAGEKLREDVQAGILDRDEAQEKAKENREKAGQKIREVLTPEQRARFDQFAGARRAGGGEGGAAAPSDAERQKRRLLDSVDTALNGLSAEEKGAILPVVRKLLDVRAEVEQAAEKRRSELEQAASQKLAKDDLAAKLAAFRAARDSDQERLKQARSAVRDLLTIEYEVKLVALGVLD